MTRPEEIAAALERWERSPYTVGSMQRRGDALARLLRAANPPAGAERATEPEMGNAALLDVSKATPFYSRDEWNSGKPDNAWTQARTRHTVEWLADNAGRFPCETSQANPEPATPAVGDDAGADCECTCASELAEKVRALLADVARLTEERERNHVINRAYRQSAHDYAANFRRADVERIEMRAERDEARATLAAVRKIADDYHDVDVTGDPPREVACNPCANEILGVLEGRKP